MNRWARGSWRSPSRTSTKTWRLLPVTELLIEVEEGQWSLHSQREDMPYKQHHWLHLEVIFRDKSIYDYKNCDLCFFLPSRYVRVDVMITSMPSNRSWTKTTHLHHTTAWGGISSCICLCVVNDVEFVDSFAILLRRLILGAEFGDKPRELAIVGHQIGICPGLQRRAPYVRHFWR